MDIKNYLKQSSLYNVISIESIFSKRSRKKITKISNIIFFSITLLLIIYVTMIDSPKFSEYKSIAQFLVPKLFGLLFLNLSLCLRMYLRSKHTKLFGA